jgi:UDP-N-acetylmuramoylalanine--D-glutamate ligase
MSQIATDAKRIVIGLGKTGYSCVRYLVAQGYSVAVMDSNPTPKLASQLQAAFPQVTCHFGGYDPTALLSAQEIIVSPGVPIATPEIAAAMKQGIPVIGDIDLFARAYQGQIVAITGSNGKSTVTELVGAMATAAGVKAAVGGNIGVPVLDLLDQDYELVVLELSSFQLETCHELKGHVATVLNVSEDHMDRYDDLQHYLTAKHRIFKHAAVIVANRQDVMTQPLIGTGSELSWYSLDELLLKGFCAPLEGNGLRTIHYNKRAWISQSELRIKGSHNVSNAMAALALGLAVGLDEAPMLAALKVFPGLDHRCQWVATHVGVDYINDSKATNVGAALAAIEGLHIKGRRNLVLIAGGVGKDADFSALASVAEKSCKHVILMGQASDELASILRGVPQSIVHSMDDAVAVATKVASAGDTVLLAPACASFDMFDGFDHRGRMFATAVEALL